MSEEVQPHVGGFCEDCGHFAGRHDSDGCHWDGYECGCPGMKWHDLRWFRPWLPAPEGLTR
jgi:hypothetical protein